MYDKDTAIFRAYNSINHVTFRKNDNATSGGYLSIQMYLTSKMKILGITGGESVQLDLTTTGVRLYVWTGDGQRTQVWNLGS